MHKGYLCLVLNAHLPFVRHPEYDDFLEEDWLYEAITETYIPLILLFERLVEEKIDFRLTISLSPTLISMLIDPLLQTRYLRHIDRLIELAKKEIKRTERKPKFRRLARMYLNQFLEARQTFQRYNRNLIVAFKKFRDLDKLEIITSGATHGYLPLMDICRESVKAQIKVAASHYESIFSRLPKGIWLPECGYQPGHDRFLKEAGFQYFFTDAHGVLKGDPAPKYGIFRPIRCEGSGLACFARDRESSKRVWSPIEGYPSDNDYREFCRDIGFDSEYDYIKPYINPDGARIYTGIKYYRITGPTDYKEPYLPERAQEKVTEHVGNFVFNRQKQIEYLYDFMQEKPIVVLPYDAELFGHWWYEGVGWLGSLIRKIALEQDEIRLITPSEYLEENPRNQVVMPSLCSWGWKGYSQTWLGDSNDWIYRHLHIASERMTGLVKSFVNVNNLLERALNQALRELLLAQSSDWAFIMNAGTHTSYAVRRTKQHLLRFSRLYEDIKADSIDEDWLLDIESKDNIFPDIDYRVHQ